MAAGPPSVENFQRRFAQAPNLLKGHWLLRAVAPWWDPLSFFPPFFLPLLPSYSFPSFSISRALHLDTFRRRSLKITARARAMEREEKKREREREKDDILKLGWSARNQFSLARISKIHGYSCTLAIDKCDRDSLLQDILSRFDGTSLCTNNT